MRLWPGRRCSRAGCSAHRSRSAAKNSTVSGRRAGGTRRPSNGRSRTSVIGGRPAASQRRGPRPGGRPRRRSRRSSSPACRPGGGRTSAGRTGRSAPSDRRTSGPTRPRARGTSPPRASPRGSWPGRRRPAGRRPRLSVGSTAAATDETIPPRLMPVTPSLAGSTSGRHASQAAARRTSQTPWRIERIERSMSAERNRFRGRPAGRRSP